VTEVSAPEKREPAGPLVALLTRVARTWLPTLVGAFAVSLVGYRFVKANRPEKPMPPADVPPFALQPRVDTGGQRLEVSAQRLVDVEIRLTPFLDAGRQVTDPAGSVIGEERRLYE
jgi:hypothetical protein